MKIRSITCFIDPGNPPNGQIISQAGTFAVKARRSFESAGFVVQTTRLATVPFPSLVVNSQELLPLAHNLEALASTAGFEYISMGPALPEFPWSYAVIPDALAQTKNVFFSGSMTTSQKEISLPSVRLCAQVIHDAAPISADGFANLRFAALANVPAGSPFFPAAYHLPGKPAFALATEAADLAVEAFSGASSLQEARQRLVDSIRGCAEDLEKIAKPLAEQYNLEFKGIDFSLAPFPDQSCSIGEAMERLGVPAVGQYGSLAASALIAESVDQASFSRVGFSGLFLPVLEDAILARRAAEGSLTVKDLLLYSAVCGTGLDTVPLPGDASTPALESVLLDVAALACRLDKPLTARLMPIPGLIAGDATGFDFAYFANSRVMSLEAAPLSGLLAGDDVFPLKPRVR
jgi:uncharacterized protein (UPF0210 family)